MIWTRSQLIAARAGTALQGLLRRLHARFHANGVGDVLGEAAVQIDEEIYRGLLAAIDGAHPLVEAHSSDTSRYGARSRCRAP